MNLAAWGTIAVLLLTAGLAPWLASRIRIPKVSDTVRWIAGAFAVACTLTAGVTASATFLARDLIPTLLNVHPLVRVAAALAFIACVAVAALAVIPDRWSSVPADNAAAVAAFLAPLLAPYSAWGIGDGARAVLEVLVRAAGQITAGITS